MAKKLFGVLLDVKEAKAERIEIEDELQEFYRVIGCDWIDITQRRIGGKPFSIVCDDEGLFVDNPKISAIDLIGNPMLVGNLLILSANNTDGELESLTEAEAAHILKRVVKIKTKNYPDEYPILTQVEY